MSQCIPRHLLGTVLAAGILCVASADLRAEDTEAARTTARELARKGDDAFAAGRCRAAIEHWVDAEKLFPAPTLRLRVARCRALLGEVQLATEALESILALAPDPAAPEAYAEARARADEELPAVRARIGSVDVRVGREGTAPEVVIAVGEERKVASSASFDVDPGKQRLRVTAGDGEYSKWVDIQDGERLAVDLRVRVEVPAAIASPQPIYGWVVVGVGAAGLAAGAVTGGLNHRA